MILPETFTPAWLQIVAQQFGKTTDLKLLEKVVRALGLLEQLRNQNLPFVFKGGTSLILHFDQPRRFSIDIDIVMAHRPGNLPALFDAIIANGTFIRWADDSDRKSHQHVPVEHYKFFYTSQIDTSGNRAGFGEEPILLDILYAQPDYARLIDKPLNHPWLQVAEPVLSVQMADVNCLLGDKLTAFAPNTTGILYSKNRPLEVMKQLFDVALLFDHATDLSLTRQTFEKLAAQEIAFRQLTVSSTDVLNDIFETALLLSRRDANDKRFLFLQDGIKRLNNFIVSDFRIEQAILAGAKAAYLSRLLQSDKNQIEHYQNPIQVVDWQISDAAFSRLNKLKKVQPEAFFYWYQCFQ
ncbi:nucleotidyl transferase AbiEii/AbiGii toxin family protein [uncultured Fibrella sp.]|uniref:nucleotidyl transferase AbiEii/AbiGii toxin family protein n=1 Tax=uncultured Fibrella sp. TaxID=1284596 RepID=UPI0035CB27B2